MHILIMQVQDVTPLNLTNVLLGAAVAACLLLAGAALLVELGARRRRRRESASVPPGARLGITMQDGGTPLGKKPRS
ncbi:MAG: hypothetical protein WB626_07765 [Bacteroidota bacterium]